MGWSSGRVWIGEGVWHLCPSCAHSWVIGLSPSGRKSRRQAGLIADEWTCLDRAPAGGLRQLSMSSLCQMQILDLD